MFELENEVRRWRGGLERDSSLSPRELDELEDHLRARVDLELDLNPALTPAKAFAVAVDGLGEPKAISREFARAGQPRWRRWLLAGWGLYAASYLLPAVLIAGISAPGGVVDVTAPGYEVWVRVFRESGLGPPLLVFLLNLPMLLTLPALWRSRRWQAPWGAVGTVGVLTLGFGVLSLGWPPTMMADGMNGSGRLGPGFWAWSASFVCAAVALRLRKRAWSPAKPGAAGELV